MHRRWRGRGAPSVPVYVAGLCAILFLERRLRVQSEDSREGLVIFAGFGMFAVMGALLVAKRPASLIG